MFASKRGSEIRVAVTGAGSNGVFRVASFEEALKKRFAPKSLEGLTIPADGMNADIHGSAEYRAHLVGVMARRAVARANETPGDEGEEQEEHGGRPDQPELLGDRGVDEVGLQVGDQLRALDRLEGPVTDAGAALGQSAVQAGAQSQTSKRNAFRRSVPNGVCSTSGWNWTP